MILKLAFNKNDKKLLFKNIYISKIHYMKYINNYNKLIY